MKLSEIAQSIQATFHGADKDFTSIATDSRKIEGGELFVAIQGEKFNGHDFIDEALLRGAKAVLAAKAPTTVLEKSSPFIQVKDTTQALGQLAAFWRSRFPIPMIGITGSCGKTTVKGMTESICHLQGKTLATKGNLNNHIGLPLTILRTDASYQYAVIEMGASSQGEIAYLGKIAKPHISLITNVRPAHLQGFGSLEGVAIAKSEIYDILPEDGVAIVNIDEPFKDLWLSKIGGRQLITVGLNNQAMISASDIQLHPFQVEFMLHVPGDKHPVSIAIPGKHTVMNALCATAAAFALGFSISNIAQGLASFEGTPRRLKHFKGVNGSCVIDDSYNANPGSMKAALEVLSRCPGDRFFIMGDMAELGSDDVRYHAEIGEYAKQKGIERLLAVGKLTEHAVSAFGKGASMFPNKQSLIAELKSSLHSQSVILVKGSRSSGMEMITDALTISKE